MVGLFKRRAPGKPRKSKFGLMLGVMLVGSGLFLYYGSHMMSDSSGDSLIESESGSVYGSLSDYHGRSLIDDECIDEDQDQVCIGMGSESSGVCKKVSKENAWWVLLLIVFVLLYLFVGIAIVCDELFVPALEIIAEELELSNDVAGATLMAAGGSAPELATSFVGTFKRSDVGFGTIVGSAVFNVLFVIAMCVMFTPEKYAPLELTWFPLLRDCSYYVFSLATLAVFMYDGTIELWEAIVQFAVYLGYILLMSKSEKLEGALNAWLAKRAGAGDKIVPGVDGSDGLDNTIEDGKPDPKVVSEMEAPPLEAGAAFTRPSTFRVGILQMLTSKNDIGEVAGVAFVSKIKGDVNAVFAHIDKNNNGEIDKNELRICLLELGTPEEELTTEKIDDCMAEMDKSGNGNATKADFTIWYTRNEQRLKNKVREVFQKYDSEKKGIINKTDVESFMISLGHKSIDFDEAIKEAMSKIDGEHLTFDEFQAWYEKSLFWESEKNAADQAAESQESIFQGVISGWHGLSDKEVPFRAKASYIITLPLSLFFCLIPDCRPPGCEKYAWGTMIGSIVAIAILAIIMVEAAEIFGKTVGIPDIVMGITILAAGTSVPDLLSSVIVAKQGQGDMAVSSSIGSNIFDVAFGLPLPWMTYNIVVVASNCNCWVKVAGDTESLMLSLLVLLLMVAAIVVIIHLSNWKMTYNLGYSMFGLYLAYIAFALLTTPKSEFVSSDCSPFSLGY